MSGKHVKVRASRWGIGTPVITAATGLVAWVVIGLALVVLPHPPGSQLGGSAQAGPAPPRSADRPDPGGASAGADGPSFAPPRTGTGRRGASDGQTGSADPSAPPGPATGSGTSAGTSAGSSAGTPQETPTGPTGAGESTRPPWADAPGKAKGHDKRSRRDPDGT